MLTQIHYTDITSTRLNFYSVFSFAGLFLVGEEDELSIKEAAELVVEGMQFTGKVEVSFVRFSRGCCTCLLGVAGGSLQTETAETSEELVDAFLSAFSSVLIGPNSSLIISVQRDN